MNFDVCRLPGTLPVDLVVNFLAGICCYSFRHFHLVLRKSSAVLAHDFRVVTVDGSNVEQVVDIRPALYHGFLEGTCRMCSLCYTVNNAT